MNPDEKNTEHLSDPVTEAPAPKKEKHQHVIIYIMILFIAAFLLMALSSLMQQRSNDEAFGKLQHSLSNMQAVQATQDQIIDLQRQLSEAEKAQDKLREEIEGLESRIEDDKVAISQEQLRTEAMLGLYNLQQNYLNQEFDACMEMLQYMEDNGLVDLLPDKAIDDATSPAMRYGQLKEALLSRAIEE